MKTGHIASALALLMCDGRYKDHAAIIPPTYMVAIASAYEFLLDLRKAMRERRRVWVMEEDIAWKKTRYDNHVNFLIKNVIMSHDNLFKKRLIVLFSMSQVFTGLQRSYSTRPASKRMQQLINVQI